MKRSKIRTSILLLLAVSVLITALTACNSEKQGKTTSGSPAESTEVVYANPTIIVDRVQAHPGDEVSVHIMLKQSPGIAACRLLVEFEKDSLELQSVSYGSAFAENGEEPGRNTSPVPLTWSQLDNIVGDELFAELRFRVSDVVKPFRVLPITVKYAPADMVNLDEEEVVFTVEDGSVEIVK